MSKNTRIKRFEEVLKRFLCFKFKHYQDLEVKDDIVLKYTNIFIN